MRVLRIRFSGIVSVVIAFFLVALLTFRTILSSQVTATSRPSASKTVPTGNPPLSGPIDPHEPNVVSPFTKAVTVELFPPVKTDVDIAKNIGWPGFKSFPSSLLLVKTGKQTVWSRLPLQISAMLQPDWPNYYVYSDHEDIIHSAIDVPIIDCLSNISDSVKSGPDFNVYRDHATSDLFGATTSSSEGWSLDKYKNLPMLRHAWLQSKQNPYDWYIMADDDTYLMKENVHSVLADLDPNGIYYLGKGTMGPNSVVFGHGGSGCVFSKGLMKLAFGSDVNEHLVDARLDRWAHKTADQCCGDLMVAIYLQDEFGIILDYGNSRQLFQSENLYLAAADTNNWCSLVGALHHVDAREMSVLRGYTEQKSLKNEAILYRDLYLDHVQPALNSPETKARITEHKLKSGQLLWGLEGWDNNARNLEYSWSLDYDFNRDLLDQKDPPRPYAAFELCELQCINKPDCTMLRYDPYTRYCGIGLSTVSLGQHMNGKKAYGELDDWFEFRLMKLNPHIVKPSRQTSERMISVWLPDRINSMRAALSCDPLSKK